MLDKARFSIGVLDVYDAALEEEWLVYRRFTVENYDGMYKGLIKRFLKTMLRLKGFKIIFKKSYLYGYWNQPFVFDV